MPDFVVLDAMGGSFYEGPPLVRTIVAGTLASVIHRGGAVFDGVARGKEVSFLLMIDNGYTSSREGTVITDPDWTLVPGWDEKFPPLDERGFNGFDTLEVSLYTPSGELYKSVKAMPMDHMVAINVPAGDNTKSGDWKYAIDHAYGFSPDQPVLLGLIDGKYAMHNGADGVWVDAENRVIRLPDNSGIYEDGTRIMPDGSITTPGGYVINPDRELRDASVKTNPVTVVEGPEGKIISIGVMLDDGTVIKTDGVVITPGRYIIALDGTITQPSREY
jgi:hypothetical protein